MPTIIRWIGALALLGSAGVAVLVSTADAQSVPVLTSTVERDATTAERTALATLVNVCWPGPLTGVRSALLQRGRGAEVNQIFLRVEGVRTLTQAEALAAVQAGQVVRANRVEEVVRGCEISLPNATLATLAAAVWTLGPLSTLREIAAWRAPTGTAIRIVGRGAQTLSAAQIDAELVAGRDVIPLGIFE